MGPRLATRAGVVSAVSDNGLKSFLNFNNVSGMPSIMVLENISSRVAGKRPWTPLGRALVGLHGMPPPMEPCAQPLLQHTTPGAPEALERGSFESFGRWSKVR